MSAYTHFRYIAYQVPTIGGVVGMGGVTYLEMDAGNALTIPRYAATGVFPPAIAAITNVDARNRVARFYAALLDARERVGTMLDDDYTLKIFMAPEFYFRPTTAASTIVPQGPAYTTAEYRQIKTALKALVNNKTFYNWIVIPGTILWSGSGAIGKRPNTGLVEVCLNTSMYMKVGYMKFKSSIVEKEQSSPIDGLPLGGGVRKATDEIWTYYQTQQKRRKHVFEHYGANCGLEICLEHARSVLKDVLSDVSNWTEGLRRTRKSISLQMITAGGIGIEAANVTVKDDGYIMRTDGLGNAFGNPQSEIWPVTGYRNKDFGLSPLPVSYGHKPSFAQFGGLINPDQVINLSAVAGSVPDPGCSPGYYFNQEVRIYPRRALH